MIGDPSFVILKPLILQRCPRRFRGRVRRFVVGSPKVELRTRDLKETPRTLTALVIMIFDDVLYFSLFLFYFILFFGLWGRCDELELESCCIIAWGARSYGWVGGGIGIVVGYSFHPDHPYVSDLGGFTEGARNGSRGCLT